jgi:hypothetical protein
MPEVAVVTPILVVNPREMTPPAPFTSWCEYAQDGYRNALEGLKAVSSGVKGYKIGTRSTEYQTAGEQGKIVDQWRQAVEYYCDIAPLPLGLSGRECAMRAIPRDI